MISVVQLTQLLLRKQWRRLMPQGDEYTIHSKQKNSTKKSGSGNEILRDMMKDDDDLDFEEIDLFDSAALKSGGGVTSSQSILINEEEEGEATFWDENGVALGFAVPPPLSSALELEEAHHNNSHFYEEGVIRSGDKNSSFSSSLDPAAGNNHPSRHTTFMFNSSQ
ncbi:Hypothetical protein, putative [Bodo saltans]|uniref:Uncharacterized protein n=1 Tax=Bodo saltans TaxID=75058 RepID=A0A0S4JUK6_BODSA|nr:Hypothetical protein, putative [Bodo saltans]|eukprot:CUG92786.1 Hypothetical protein, putative [Bodo saltans]